MKKEDLDKAKIIELEVMDYFDKICKKYDINIKIYTKEIPLKGTSL